MPRFFFDIDECDFTFRDDEGLDLPDLNHAIVQSRMTLPALAREVPSDRASWRIRSSVRDETGTVVFEATLDLQSRHFSHNADQAEEAPPQQPDPSRVTHRNAGIRR